MASVDVRRSEDRGTTRTPWLLSRHSFAFGRYRDNRHRHIGPLRVLNDDRVDPGAGFDPHPHRDMEIVSYVLEGSMEHEDSRGHRGLIEDGQIQFMRAGTGVTHSEYNASDDDVLRFLQVWFLPHSKGLEPNYEKTTPELADDGGWTVLVDGFGDLPDPATGDGIEIAAHGAMLGARPDAGVTSAYPLTGDRQAYVFVIDGQVDVDGATLGARDAARVQGDAVAVEAEQSSHVLLFDLAPDDAVSG